jgi:CDP-glycerol glycerophosphotransferase (TagB/SpsB family)
MKSDSHFTVNKIASRLSGVQSDLIFLIIIPLRFLVELLDIVYPKDDKTIIFGSHSGEFMSGSPKALYDFALSNKYDFRCYYYLPFGQHRNFVQIFVYILKYFHKFFRARYLVTSHPPSDFYPYFWSKRKVVINTWHGNPMKNMFFADNGWKSYLDRLAGC